MDDVKPTKEHKTLLEYVRANAGYRPNIAEMLAENKGPCPDCWGRGRVVAPYERACPIEGYKMADRIACPKCNGDGRIPKKEWVESYKKYNAAFKERVSQWQERETRRRELIESVGYDIVEEIINLWR